MFVFPQIIHFFSSIDLCVVFVSLPRPPTGENMILIDGGISEEKASDMFRLN
jgi:hypothetical protein